jgi:hypothetical protein
MCSMASSFSEYDCSEFNACFGTRSSEAWQRAEFHLSLECACVNVKSAAAKYLNPLSHWSDLLRGDNRVVPYVQDLDYLCI